MAYTFIPEVRPRQIQLDLSPARLTLQTNDDELIGAETRVIVTDSHLYVFRDGSKEPDNFILKDLVSFSGRTATGYQVETSDGSVYHVMRNPSCACGTRLRSFHPFPGVPHAPTPKRLT